MIVYVIGNYRYFNSGHGGHNYSVLNTAKHMRSHEETIIYSLGHEQPKPLVGCDFAVHIKSRGPSKSSADLILADLRLRGIADDVTIVHFFDYNSAISSLELAKELNVPLVITKCGGKPISWLRPVFSNTILYHEGDLEVFYSRIKDRRYLQVIPNRVGPIPYEHERAMSLLGSKSEFVIFRIGRIGRAYEKTIAQSIDLVAGLNQVGFRCRLDVIGYVEDQKVLEKIKEHAQAIGPYVKFYVEPSETQNAAGLLEYCDAVVGTGRGAMEAMSKGRIILFPCSNRNLPCIMTQETWVCAAEENFSERVKLPFILSEYSTVQGISELLQDKNVRRDLSDFSLRIFDKRYNILKGVDKIWDYYQTLLVNKSYGFKVGHPFGRLSLKLYFWVAEVVKKFRGR